MKNKKWIAIPITVLCVAVVTAGIFLFLHFFNRIAEAENTYEPVYKSFCTSPQSAEITIDGKLKEEAWKGKGWFTDTYLQNTTGVMPKWKVTGFPTEEGIYLAAVAEDNNLVNDGEHTMAKNSSFGFYVEVDNVGEKHANDLLYATQINVDMRGDAHSSAGNNFDRAVVVQGKLNSKETKKATAEIFLPWDFLQVDVSKGIPEEFRLYPVYRGVFEGEDWCTDMVLPVGSAEYDIYNYWRFNRDGYMTPDREGAVLGDTVTGVAKTGNWDVSEEQEGIVRSSYGTEHHVIFDKEHYESDFIAEVTMIPVQSLDNEWPKAGFYFLNTKGEWHAILQDMRKDLLVDAVNGTKNVNKLSLVSVDQTWNWKDYTKETIENPNAAKTEGVNLKVVKYNGCFWYFANDQYITAEKKDFMDTEVFPGFYALGMDVNYKDYSYTSIKDMDALKAYLNARGIYIIDAKAATSGGKVEASAISVKKGEKYSITVTCESGYEVSSILVNGVEKLADAKRNAVDGVYTLTAADGNQEIRVSFKKCDGFKMTGYVLSEKDGSKLDADMILTGKGNRILRYQISSNSKKGYTVVMPKDAYKVYVTSDGYIALEETVSLNKELKKDFRLKPSLFAKEVEINGTKVYSNMSVWNMRNEGKGIVSTSYDAGGKMQPLFFAKTGKEAVFQANIQYTTRFEAGKEYQPDLFGGLYVTDGKNSGYILAVQNKLLYGDWQWTDVVIPGPVLMYPNPVPAEMAVALKDGYFYVYINDNFAAKMRTSDVVPGSSQNAEFAYGIYMIADKTADIAFQNFSFSTDSREVANYLAQQSKTSVWKENSTFARAVMINGVRKASAKEVWDTSEIGRNILKGSFAMGTKMQPFYFAKTGKQALYQAKIEYTTRFEAGREYQNDLFGGLYVTDGTNNGYILAVQNKLVYGDWKWTDVVLPGPVLMYPNPAPAEMAVVLKDGYFYVYVNDNFAAKLSVAKVVPKASQNAELAFGVCMNADKTADIRFSEISFSTDSKDIESFLARQNETVVWDGNSMFAKAVMVNGVRKASAKEVWDTSEIGKNILKGSFAMGTKMQPFYFTKTGKQALYQAKIEYTTRFEAGKEYQNDLHGGLYVTDGTNSGYILAAQNKLIYGDWKWTDVVLPGPVLMYPEPVPAEMAVVLKDGYFYVYVNDNFAAKLSVAEVVPKASQNAKLAFGVCMNADQTADIRFSEISFSTDSKDIESFLARQNGTVAWDENSMFAKAVSVNGIRKASAKEAWDTSEIEKNILKGSYAMGTKMQPFYFAETGNIALYQAKIEYTTKFEAGKEYQNDLAGGLFVTDGDNSGFILAVQNKLVYGDWKWTDVVLQEPVLMYPNPVPAEMAVALQNGYFYVYVNDVYTVKLNASAVVPGTAQDAEFAFGVCMNADKTADIEFSDIQFTTDAAAVDAFLLSQNGIFAEQVTVNGNVINSGTSVWNREKELDGILTVKNGGWGQPMILKEIGTSSLLQTRIENIGGTEADGWVRNVFGGLWATDGTNYGFLMAINNGIAVGTDFNNRPISLDKYVLMPPGSGGENPIELAVARKGAYIYVYADGVFKKKLRVSDVISNASDDAELAFGLIMDRGEDGGNSELKFSKISYTTDAAAVDAFLLPENGIFTEQVTVNGNVINSGTSVWNREKELEGILTVKNGSWGQPMILKGTGTASLLQTRIENSGGKEADGWVRNVFGGLWATDGTNYGFLMAINNGIAVGTDFNNRPIPLDKYVLMPPGSGGENPIEIAVARKGAYIYVYVDGVYNKTLAVSDVIPGASDDTELAFGLTMDRGGDGGNSELQFSKISYTTDAAAVDAFMAEKGTTELRRKRRAYTDERGFQWAKGVNVPKEVIK